MKTIQDLEIQKSALDSEIASLNDRRRNVELQIHELRFGVKRGEIVTANEHRFRVHSFDDDGPYLQRERDGEWEQKPRLARFWSEWKQGGAKTPMRRY